MAKVYLIKESDIESLKTKLDLSEFKTHFPLHRVTKSVSDPTQEQALFLEKHWDVLVYEAHKHFVYYVHSWLNEVMR
jgi:hypothetical protein